ncbi:MAG: hypothetical protein WBA41_25725, partial [Rivularia sp. (in: cyanobacteria)]
GWGCVGAVLALRIRSQLLLLSASLVTAVIIYGVCFILFIQGVWLPLVPSTLTLFLTTGSLVVIYIYKVPTYGLDRAT